MQLVTPVCFGNIRAVAFAMLPKCTYRRKSSLLVSVDLYSALVRLPVLCVTKYMQFIFHLCSVALPVLRDELRPRVTNVSLYALRRYSFDAAALVSPRRCRCGRGSSGREGRLLLIPSIDGPLPPLAWLLSARPVVRTEVAGAVLIPGALQWRRGADT